MQVPLLDAGTYAASLLLVAGYHLFLKMRTQRDHAYTIQSVNNTARIAWVENIMSDKSNGILAVQTLRNSTMAATFLASTAILMSMGALNLMGKMSGTSSVLDALQTGKLSNIGFQNDKLLILMVIYIWAFFCFSMAVRMYNHVGYLINSTNPRLKFSPSARYVSEILNRSGTYYAYGMRAYYISVPMIFSLYDPYFMTVATVGLIMLLYHIDRAPKGEMSRDFDIRRNLREIQQDLAAHD